MKNMEFFKRLKKANMEQVDVWATPHMITQKKFLLFFQIN